EADKNLPRKAGMIKLGWKDGLGFPITEDGNVIAVIECFNKNELTPKQDLLEVLENSGRQIGVYIERKKIEEKLKESYEELENKVKERTNELANTLTRLLEEIEEKEKVQKSLVDDIVLRKQIENDLIESRNSLLEAQSIAKLGSWEWDVKKNIVKWSDELLSIYQITPEEFNPTYEGFLSWLHPDDVEKVKKNVENAYNSKSSFDFYERIVTPDGSIKILRCQGGVRADENDNVTKLVGTCLDVTLVKQAEELIRENEERLRIILESIKDYAILMIDDNGVIKTWNKAAEQIKGYKREEIVGKHISIFYTEKDREKKEPPNNLEKERKIAPFEKEGWRVKKDGSLFWAN